MAFDEKVDSSSITADDPQRWDSIPVGASPFPLGAEFMVKQALQALDQAEQKPDPETSNQI